MGRTGRRWIAFYAPHVGHKVSRTRRMVPAEHDDEACAALLTAVRSVGALRIWHWRGHGGSQDLESWIFLVGWRLVRLHRETFMGLTITGSPSLVETLCAKAKVSSVVAVP